MSKIKMKLLRPLALGLINLLASDIRDVRTGEIIGRALLLPWRGRILFFGTSPDLLPIFRPQSQMLQWRSTLGFTKHPSPDFPHEPRP